MRIWILKKEQEELLYAARTKLPNNTVHIRFRKGDESINKIIEFGFSDDYIEREYELTGISLRI